MTPKYFLAFLSFFLLLGSLSAISMTTPTGFATKTTGKASISLNDVYTEIQPNQTTHYYFVEYSKAISPKKLALSIADVKMGKATPISNLVVLPILNATNWSKTDYYQSCGFDVENNTICTAIPFQTQMTTYELGENTTFDSDKYTQYMVGLMTGNWKSDSFNITIASEFLDPSVSACGSFTTSNSVLTLTQNIDGNFTACITISTGTNITLDGNGFNITAVNGTGTCILSASNNVSIKNLNCKNMSVGYDIRGVSSILNNVSMDGKNYAFYWAGAAHDGIINNSWGNVLSQQCAFINNLADNLTVQNTNCTTAAGAQGWFIQGTTNSRFNNIRGTSLGGLQGIAFSTNANNNILNNSFGNSTGGSGAPYGIVAQITSIGNQIINSTGWTNTANGRGISIGSANTLVDCNGATLMGANASNSAGIYIADANVTVTNCNIGNWTYVFYMSSNDKGNVSRITCATSGYCAGYVSAATNSLIDNVSLHGVAAITFGNAGTKNVTVQNSLLNGTTYGFDCSARSSGATNMTFQNNTVYGVAYSDCPNSNIIGNTIYPTSTGNGINLASATGSNQTVIGNTIINTGTGTCLVIATASGNSIIYQNNFTGAKWINDANGTNNYNTSAIGNIYTLSNGTTYTHKNWTGGTWATGGTPDGYPLNATTAPSGYWVGLGQDFHPFIFTTLSFSQMQLCDNSGLCNLYNSTCNPYQTMFATWASFTLNATDNAPANATRTYNCSISFLNGTIRTLSGSYANGTGTTINITGLTAADSGDPIYADCTATVNDSGTSYMLTTSANNACFGAKANMARVVVGISENTAQPQKAEPQAMGIPLFVMAALVLAFIYISTYRNNYKPGAGNPA